MSTDLPIRLSRPLPNSRAMLKNFLSELNHALHYHLLNPYKRIITFIPRAIEWVRILWDAQTAIEAFGGGEEIVEGWICLYEDDSMDTPSIIAAINYLKPEILSEWLNDYEPSLNGTYAHPELVDDFVEIYGRFIGRNQETAKQRLRSTSGAER
jgi:hypothetical protein